MPRLAFRNDRTRVWTKNGKARVTKKVRRYIVKDGFYSVCHDCRGLFAIDPQTGKFNVTHRTIDNIPHLYCAGNAGSVGVWLDANTGHNVVDVKNVIDTPFIVE